MEQAANTGCTLFFFRQSGRMWGNLTNGEDAQCETVAERL
jgi:hypothetical protein